MLIFLKTTTFHRFKMIAHFIKICVYDQKNSRYDGIYDVLRHPGNPRYLSSLTR
uniref:Protein kinase domain-containing protein n=1 Tax=Heterorhabditis bacteriophora TaxID=37862 RepID=A0A1I7X104_HETBA